MVAVVNINDVLDGHVALEVECVDRLYLNAYVPQPAGAVVRWSRFLTEHLGFPDPFAGLLRQDRQPVPARGEGVRRRARGCPILRLEEARPHAAGTTASSTTSARIWSGRSAKGASGSSRSWPAQEFQWVFSADNRSDKPGVVSFDFFKEERRVGVYYFYILDPDFGPGVHQDLHLLPLSGQGVGQRPRVGQTAGARHGIGVHRAVQRVRLV